MKTPFVEILKKRSVRIWTAVGIIVLLLLGASLLVWQTSERMFEKNARYTITKVELRSDGFWKGKQELLCQILRIQPGVTNLFSIDPGELRMRLLRREPSIEQVRIIRIIPNILRVEILERIPIARINRPDAEYVLDAKAILMRRDHCLDIRKSLPVIYPLTDESRYAPGMRIASMEQAAALIMLTKTNYPDVRLSTISTEKPGQLQCVLYYKRMRGAFLVTMDDRDLRKNMQKLITSLNYIERANSGKRTVNLLYGGVSVLRD